MFKRCCFKLAGNGSRLGEGRALKTDSPNIVQMLIEVQMLNYFRLPCFCQTDVRQRFLLHFQIFLWYAEI